VTAENPAPAASGSGCHLGHALEFEGSTGRFSDRVASPNSATTSGGFGVGLSVCRRSRAPAVQLGGLEQGGSLLSFTVPLEGSRLPRVALDGRATPNRSFNHPVRWLNAVPVGFATIV